jgi:hypothetical protein
VGILRQVEEVFGLQIWDESVGGPTGIPDAHTSVYIVPLMEVINSLKDLSDSLRCVLLGELALVADPVEQLASYS